MSQYIEPAQAFGAVASYLAQNASPMSTDQRDLHYRFAQKITVGKGTTQYGTLKSLNTNERDLQMPDDVYAAMVAAGVSFASDLYNSSSTRGAYANTSEIPSLFNPGVHRQVIICKGDSITNLSIGATSYKKLALQKNRIWALGMGVLPSACVYGAPVTLPVTAPQAPEFVYSKRWAHEKSRIKFNFGHDSWRLVDQPGMAYDTPVALTGSPHNDNMGQLSKLVLATGQQLVIQNFIGTNDFNYADQNSNPGLAAVPTGTVGASSTGSPNYITDCLIPALALDKMAYPTSKSLFVLMLARSLAAGLNNKFIDVANYVIANKVALGIDCIIDSRQIPQFTPTDPTVTSSAVNYQTGNVHPSPAGAAVLDPYFQAAYDKLLGFTPNPTYAGALA